MKNYLSVFDKIDRYSTFLRIVYNYNLSIPFLYKVEDQVKIIEYDKNIEIVIPDYKMFSIWPGVSESDYSVLELYLKVKKTSDMEGVILNMLFFLHQKLYWIFILVIMFGVYIIPIQFISALLSKNKAPLSMWYVFTPFAFIFLSFTHIWIKYKTNNLINAVLAVKSYALLMANEIKAYIDECILFEFEEDYVKEYIKQNIECFCYFRLLGNKTPINESISFLKGRYSRTINFEDNFFCLEKEKVESIKRQSRFKFE